MIKQLSGCCYEWVGGDFNVKFLDDFSHEKRHDFQKIPRFYKPLSDRKPTDKVKRFTQAEILPVRDIIEPIICKYGRFDLCGSFRRGKDTVKDLDYVINTSRQEFIRLRSELTMAGVNFQRGAMEIMNGSINGIACDFFRADSDSYTSILIWRTGSKDHNIYCAAVAMRKGLRVVRNGIKLKDGTIFHPKTEDEFYHHLGVKPMLPNERG